MKHQTYAYIDDILMDIEAFNEIAGNLDYISDMNIRAQLKLIKEEVVELQSAIENDEGSVQILKETTDVFVVLVGLIQMLEKKGYNWEKAQLKVGQNNIDKFISGEDAQGLEDTLKMYTDLGIDVMAKYNEEYNMFVIIDKAGKVRKPIGYEKCDVSDFIPQ